MGIWPGPNKKLIRLVKEHKIWEPRIGASLYRLNVNAAACLLNYCSCIKEGSFLCITVKKLKMLLNILCELQGQMIDISGYSEHSTVWDLLQNVNSMKIRHVLRFVMVCQGTEMCYTLSIILFLVTKHNILKADFTFIISKIVKLLCWVHYIRLISLCGQRTHACISFYIINMHVWGLNVLKFNNFLK
jgi:hypothetical protein